MGSTVIDRLLGIEKLRRPVHKVVLSGVEGWLGHHFYRRRPPARKSRLLHLGCGDHHFRDWVNADYYRFSDLVRKRRDLPDWMLDAARPWNCPDDYWDGIHTEHTLEHLDYQGAIAALREAHRTLRPGAWIRIVLPGAHEALHDPGYFSAAEAIGALTQTHGHLSVWDEELLCAVLRELGFSDVRPTQFRVGTDPRLVMDLAERAPESLYVEARK